MRKAKKKVNRNTACSLPKLFRMREVGWDVGNFPLHGSML